MSILNKTKNRIDLFVTKVLGISARKLLVKVNTEQKTMHSQESEPEEHQRGPSDRDSPLSVDIQSNTMITCHPDDYLISFCQVLG